LMLAVSLQVVPKSWRSTSARTATTVSLIALRGGSADAQNAAPAGAPLNFSIDASDLTVTGKHRIEMVDSGGSQVWSSETSVSQGKLLAHLGQSPKPGLYWVRLYTAGELVREFGLRLE